MSPQSNSTPGLSLPSPTLEASGSVQQPSNPAPAQAPVQGQIQSIINSPVPEVQPPQLPPAVPLAPAPAPVSAPTAPQQPAMVQLPVNPATQTPAPILVPSQNIASPQPIPQAVPTQDEELNLDDDALDEEWVNKAKSVAEQYQADPYMASKALSKVKAEYLQRRYGKQLKVSD